MYRKPTGIEIEGVVFINGVGSVADTAGKTMNIKVPPFSDLGPQRFNIFRAYQIWPFGFWVLNCLSVFLWRKTIESV